MSEYWVLLDTMDIFCFVSGEDVSFNNNKNDDNKALMSMMTSIKKETTAMKYT